MPRKTFSFLAGELEEQLENLKFIDECRIENVEPIGGGRFRVTANCPPFSLGSVSDGHGSTAGGASGGNSTGGTAPSGATSHGPVIVGQPVDPNKRNTDLNELHPIVRDKVTKVLAELKKNKIPMSVFEAFRSPERQAHLFKKRPKVTNANAWQSFHQYGMAVDIVIDAPDINPWDTGSAKTRGWWDKYHAIALKHGLKPLSFEMPHVQIADIVNHTKLLAGEYPPGGDASWAQNLTAAVQRWPGSRKPPIPDIEERPPLQLTTSLNGAPEPISSGWHNLFGGQEWRYDNRGVYLRSFDNGNLPLRSPGAPITAQTIVHLYGEAIVKAAKEYNIPPQLIVMTIATEAGAFRDDNFTGPKTFRWEQGVTIGATIDTALHGQKGDYSAGPMQVVGDTARWVAQQQDLAQYVGKIDQTFKVFKKKPTNPPKDLPMYKGDISIDIGAAVIKQRIEKTGLDPILVAAAYNAGSLRSSFDSVWRIHTFGNHLDRAAQWYGDACAVLST